MGALFDFKEKKKRKIDREYGRVSFSQEGEDLLLAEFFADKKTPGFYVDVGAFHPFRCSNTYFFYKLGWRGLNIDATPGAMAPFREHRPRDINVEQPIGQVRRPLSFFVFNDPALNGFSRELSEQRAGIGSYHIVRTVELETAPLSSVLEQHLPPGQEIDFMTIDVEGFDLEVLHSNNWSKYAPKLVVIEATETLELHELAALEPSRFLLEQGYHLVARTLRNLIYQRSGT